MRIIYLVSLIFLVSSCKKTKVYLSTVRANTEAVDSRFAPVSSIDSFIAPYKLELDAEMKQVLSYTPVDLVKTDSLKQTTLGNLTADICFEMATSIYKDRTGHTIDFALFNYGGLRTILSKGSITKGDVFKVMPFENELVVVTLSAKKVTELIEFFIRSSRTHPISKEVDLTIDQDSFNLEIQGQKFDPSKTYRILTSDYLQNGGSNMNFFKEPITIDHLNYKVRAALLDYFTNIDTVRVKIDGRVNFR